LKHGRKARQDEQMKGGRNELEEEVKGVSIVELPVPLVCLFEE
jgi:hypothetical protein